LQDGPAADQEWAAPKQEIGCFESGNRLLRIRKSAAADQESAASNQELAAPNQELAAPNQELAAPNQEIGCFESGIDRARRKR
jgi:hypothetical protein